MVLNSRKEIRNAALSMTIAYFGSNGYVVSVPLNDTQDYDLVVDKDGKLQKVQVKGTNRRGTGNAYTIGLRTISGTTRQVYKTVIDTDVDLLFCLCGDGTMYLIPKEDVANRCEINLSKEKSKDSKKLSQSYERYVVTM